MQHYQHYRIEGVLRTITPLHITDAARSARWDPEAQRMTYGNDGFPLTLTRSMPVFIGAISGEDGETFTSYHDVPIIPASTWRGALRREASKIIEEHIMERGEKLSFQAYMGMRCGAVSGKPEGTQPITEEVLRARGHVFYGLFGGGPRMLRSYMRIADSLPITRELIEAGIIPEYMEDDALYGERGKHHLKNLFVVNSIVRKDDFTAEEAGDVVANFAETFDAMRVKQVEQKKNKKKDEDEEEGERGVRTLSFRQDVALGVPFYFRAQVHGTPAQVGIILEAMARRLKEGVGGRAALGFGQLASRLNIRLEDGSVLQALAYDGENITLFDEAMPFIEACRNEVAQTTQKDMEYFVISRKKPKKKKGEHADDAAED